MFIPFKKLIKPTLCLIILLYGSTVIAQVPSLQKLMDKAESYHNLSYQSITKRRDGSADTVVAHNKELFLKATDDKLYGYLYSIETDYKTEAFHKIDLYNREGFTILSVADSAFFPGDGSSAEYSRSIIGGLKFLEDRYNKKPYKITTLADTIIDGTANLHWVAHVYDTLDRKEHLYSNRAYYINKQTGLPSMVTITGRYQYNGLVNDYYNETKYFNYKIDQPGISAANFAIPTTYKPRVYQTAPALLAAGTTAPDWTLYDANGHKLSLSQLKGKVVMLDFYFIGCSGCMASLKPLNAIYEKFKNKDLVIASLTARDSKKAVLNFEQRYQIKYTGYINAADVVKSYQVTAFPTFYFIDRDGKIGEVFVGYNDDFEEKVTSVVNNLLSKK